MKLQSVIERAKAINMPKDNIERAIRRATDKGALALFEITVKALTKILINKLEENEDIKKVRTRIGN